MDLESAIKTAIDFETKVRDAYRNAETKVSDEKGRKVLAVLAGEEQGHLDYLQHCLNEWRTQGQLSPTRLQTSIPSRQAIAEGVKRMSSQMKGEQRAGSELELQLLQQALQAEQETSAFYQRMVSELPAEHRPLFQRFLEIEQGHVSIVQAEIDAVTGLGFWFDVQEFRLEAG